MGRGMKVDVMLYVSLGLFAVVLLLLWLRIFNKSTAWLLFVPLTALVVLSLFYGVSDYFTASGIDESVLFHLRVGLEGAGFLEYVWLITLVLLLLAAWLCFFALLLRRCLPVNSRRGVFYSGLGISLLALAANPACHDLYTLYLLRPMEPATGFISHYIRKPQVLGTTQSPLNLVYIYAESLEETYFDESLFPGLLPNLTALREQALVFENVSQVPNSDWTIAAMVASQCGVPLFMSSGGNSLSGMSDFLVGATCMGDILRQQDYFLSYMGGASSHFAGKGNFYRSHGFHQIQGLEELRARQSDSDYQSSWGIYDDELFEFAREDLASLQKTDKPFALFLLTLDTHHPRGHLSRSCEGLKYPHQDNPMLDAVHCADLLLSKFIKDIQQGELAENTVLVLGSDHLAMKNTAYPSLVQGQRKNLLLMMPPGLEAGQRIQTPATTLDAGITAMGLMGIDVPGIGFGRDILAGEPALIERVDGFGQQLNAHRTELDYLWRYPSLAAGMKFDQQNKLRIQATEYTYPLVLLVNDQQVVEAVLFEFESDTPLVNRILERPMGQRYVWIDRCEKLEPSHTEVVDTEEYCVEVARMGVKRSIMQPVLPGMEIGSKKINKVFHNKRTLSETHIWAQQERLTRLLGKRDVNSVNFKVSGFPYKEMHVVSSPGIGLGPSSVQYWQDGEAVTQDLERGLNVMALRPKAVPELLYRLDGCAREQADSDDIRLADIVADYPDGQILLAVHDSAHCGETEWLQTFFAGTGFSKGAALNMRQGYAALMIPSGETYELLGAPQQILEITLLGQ